MASLDINDVRIAVVGLGYVGLPLARLFATRYPTVGYDCNAMRIDRIPVPTDGCKLSFSADSKSIRPCNFYVIAVPTPVDVSKCPDLGPLLDASRTVGSVLRNGDVVVYESTVYPGTTEDECVPVLEASSGLVCNRDFYVGYSPERINPGDAAHTVENVCKIVSGSTQATADFIDAVYRSVLRGGTCKVSSIRVAEAAKILENCQRDVNIAFVNEAAKILNAMDIDTHEVLDAAATKWNFLNFSPGLVGGHCISVDPYYLIRRAKTYGVTSQVMSAAREVNESMGPYVADQVVKCMNSKGILAKGSDVLILGYAFKENCADIRNTKVVDVCRALEAYGCNISVYDPLVDMDAVCKSYSMRMVADVPVGRFDAIVFCVAHSAFEGMDVRSFLTGNGIVYDVKGVLPVETVDGRL